MKFTREFLGICLCMVLCLITVFCLMAGGGLIIAQLFAIPTAIGVIIFGLSYLCLTGIAFWLFASTATQEDEK